MAGTQGKGARAMAMGQAGDPVEEALGLRSDPHAEYLEAHHGNRPPASLRLTAVSAIGAVLLGLVLGAGLSTGRSVARAQDERRAELIELIAERREHTAALGERLDELRSELAETEEEIAAGLPALRADLAELERAAGLTGLAGPGVVVELGDAEGDCPTGRPDDCRIQDIDVQLAVNALFALGAEGIAVNGERVIATTAIRSAGRTVLVNYRVLTSPYEIAAIGNQRRLADGFVRSELGADLEVWQEAYGLELDVREVDEVSLPPYGGSTRLRNATTLEEPR